MIRDVMETLSRLMSVFRRRSLDRDFDDEFASHVEMITEQNERRGLPHDEARRQAILQMGGMNATQYLHREARGLPPLERFMELIQSVGRDFTHAARSLGKTKGFTFVCVASLGIGMGTFLAILIFTRSIMAPPIGVNPDNLVELIVRPQGELQQRIGDWVEQWSYLDFEAVRNADPGLEVAAWAIGQTKFQRSEDVVDSPYAMFVSSNYFSTVGVPLVRGQGFDPAIDDQPLAQPRAVLEYDFWQNVLNGDPAIIGKTVTFDSIPHVVVGVAPDGFRGHLQPQEGPSPQVFMPLARHPRFVADRFNRDIDWVRLVGRLSPGFGIERANAAVSAMMTGLAEQYPASNEFKKASVETYFATGADNRSDFLVIQTLFLTLAGVALLIVCLNISGMMLVRAAARERELSIREAIGASRGSLIRYLLSEAFLLAGLGGALGPFVLFGVIPALTWWRFGGVPEQLKPDPIVALTCVALCVGTSLAFGLLPALRFSRPVIISAMKDDAGGGGRRVGRMHRWAAIVQISLVLPFLVVSGVGLNQARATVSADLGFEPEGLSAVRVDLAEVAGEEGAEFFLRNVQANLEREPGVESSSVADGLPLDFRRRFVLNAGPDLADFPIHTTRVGQRYLETMGVRLLRGRDFTSEDRAGTPPVVIISEPLADRLFPDTDPIGQEFTFAFAENRRERITATVVGVTAHFVTSQVTTLPEQIMLPMAQHPASSVFLIARGEAADEALTRATSAFATAIRIVDPVFFRNHRTITGEQLVDNSVEDFINQAAVGGAIGIVVLALGALGVCGVIGFMVATRRREIAVRIALGATHRSVVGLVFFDVVKLILPGIAVGLIITAAIVRTIFVPFYEFTTMEPVIYSLAGLIVILVGCLASLPSAYRAAAVPPMVAMRSE